MSPLIFDGKSPRMPSFPQNFKELRLWSRGSRNWSITMANTAQAEKRARQAQAQRAHNMSLRSTLRTAVKKVRKAVAEGNKTAAQAVFQASISTIDSIADKKIIHKNTASRTKSRLSAAVKGMAA